MKTSQSWLINYPAILNKLEIQSEYDLVTFTSEGLPFIWRDVYIENTKRPTSIVIIRYGTFEYVYDHFPVLQPEDAEPCDDPSIEPRLVAAFGRSSPDARARDDYRLKGWVGATEKTFGKGWDKGHFIAHSIGGAVDGAEVNVFVQRRDLNRGWSEAGKRFRQMEEYCVTNSGTFCFCRPFYGDQSAKPLLIEFGVLRGNCEIWAECFDNQKEC